MMRHIRELCPKAGGKFKRPSQRSARNNEENGNEVRDMCLDSWFSGKNNVRNDLLVYGFCRIDSNKHFHTKFYFVARL